MKWIEYGATDKEPIVLLHGGGLCWWNYAEEAELLKNDHHVILPILDGHAGSDRPFTSIEDNAAEIIAYVDRRLGGSVPLIGGLSLGGQILLEMLAQRRDICRYALIESAMAIPSRLTHALIAPAFGCSYGLIRRKWFAKLQFQSLRIKPSLFDAYYRDTSRISKADMIAFMKANTSNALKESVCRCGAEIHLFVGSKETPGIRRSAELLRDRLPGASLTVLPGYHHGDFSINHGAEYVQAVQKILGR